ncbi:phosphoglucosamine mutase [bacterium]|nr:phosphoglucosamine mutase [bacterium]
MNMEKKLIISVAGIRGIYPLPLSPETVYKFGFAFGVYSSGKDVFVAQDTRISGSTLKYALLSGLLSAGINVIDLNVGSTPLLTYIIEKNPNVCGVMISASHNPKEYNGLKFVSSKGTFLNEKEGAEFLSIYKNIDSYQIPSQPGKIISSQNETYRESFFNDIYNKVNLAKIRERKFKVVVDVCQGVGAFETRLFLEGLGCKTVVINAEPPGVFSHNPEPLPENLKELSKKVVEEKADIGFAQDPDCDRLAFVCEDGVIPGEELTLALSVLNILEKERGSVAVNLSTSSIIEYVSNMFDVNVYRSKIGEVNVVEKMKEKNAIIGGEGNGGVILPSIHYGRDSYVAMALILELMAVKDKKVSEILSVLPRYIMIKEKLVLEEVKKTSILQAIRDKYSKNEEVNLDDGIKIIRKDGWIHIRPSGTEPILRVYVEGENQSIAKAYLSEIYQFVNSQ